MRRQNLALVLGTVSAADADAPLSRADVAGRTGLTRAAVSSLVDELIADGLLVEAESAPSGRVGRPGRALAVSDRGPCGLGLEVGVTHLGACAVDLRGRARVWRRVERGNAGRPAGEVLAELAALGREAEVEAAALGLSVAGRVLAVPGVVSRATAALAHAEARADLAGVPDSAAAPHAAVERAANLGWEAMDPADHWPWPDAVPEVENEANLGALAELWAGRPAGAVGDTFVHVSAAVGIGAALVVDGRLFRGARGFAGELGHLPVHPEGPPCACGARGCLELYAGEAAVLREAALDPQGADPVTALAQRARAADPHTIDALTRAGRAIGLALTAAVDLVDPSALVLGGAYAELAEWLLPPMRAELAARVRVRPWDADGLRASALGRRGPLLGAGLLTVRRILTDPGARG
ncbi:ROK family transcriptional regulator [Streptacidiphilus rugosus]|uniref:ROK family transcriptional regulator n=1 Tax=Streptacidiphilus rugosus TaxID=405783 RepID=UPI00068D058B|nr:ROK family transcriptional regulator [Streptacidiphilus rugosus]